MTIELVRWLVPALVVGGLSASAFVSAQSPDTGAPCAVTLTSPQSVAGAPRSEELDSSRGWFGNEQLAALLPSDGKWVGMGPERMYGDKFWWWRSGYSAFEEPRPNLTISATRIDGVASDVQISNATNAYGDGWHSMLVGMEFPSAGCWEVTGTYNGSQQLVFVLLVGSA